MSTLLNTVNNGIGVFGPVAVNMITDTNVTIGVPANSDVVLDAQNVTLRAVSVLGTLSVAGTAIVDNATTGQNVTSSTTFTSIATGQATPLAIPANHVLVNGDPDTVYYRFHITANAVGQASTFVFRLDNIATITTAAVHGLSPGDVIEQRSFTDTTFNGRFTVVSVPTTTTYTVYNPGVDKGTTADVAGRVGAFDAILTLNALQVG